MTAISTPAGRRQYQRSTGPRRTSQFLSALSTDITLAAVLDVKVRAILFDLDGVLVDSTVGVELALRDWATRQRLDQRR
jgi:hypothetical protein